MRKKNYNLTEPHRNKKGEITTWEWSVVQRMTVIEYGSSFENYYRFRKMDAEQKDHTLRMMVEECEGFYNPVKGAADDSPESDANPD